VGRGCFTKKPLPPHPCPKKLLDYDNSKLFYILEAFTILLNIGFFNQESL
jgi:hypothetical protein